MAQAGELGGGLSSHVSGMPEEGDDEGSMGRSMERTFSSSHRDSRRFSSMFTRSFAARIPPEGKMGSVLDFGPASVPTLQVFFTLSACPLLPFLDSPLVSAPQAQIATIGSPYNPLILSLNNAPLLLYKIITIPLFTGQWTALDSMSWNMAHLYFVGSLP